MTLRSSIYSGSVTHSRSAPRSHRFSYRVWWILIDLDELDELDRSLRLFAYNRFNLFSVHDRDFGRGDGALCTYIKDRLAAAGLAHAGARIELLTMPRMCGYAFNPLSVYFCRDATGRVSAIVYEVHNTFGERHSYVIEATEGEKDVVRQAADKSFYVSPFMDMSQDYQFRVRLPGESVTVAVTGLQRGEAVIHTALQGRRSPLTSMALLRRCLSYPLLTLKVTAAIHWQALRIWRKGIRIRAREPITGHSVTLGRPATRVEGDNV